MKLPPVQILVVVANIRLRTWLLLEYENEDGNDGEGTHKVPNTVKKGVPSPDDKGFVE